MVCLADLQMPNINAKPQNAGMPGTDEGWLSRTCTGVPMVCLAIWHWYMLRGLWL